MVKKLADILEEDYKKEIRQSTELQNKADAIKAFCGKPEGYEQGEVQDEDEAESQMKYMVV